VLLSIPTNPSNPPAGIVRDIPHSPLAATVTGPLSLSTVVPPKVFQNRTRTSSAVVAKLRT
jgi:hypothetical protein